jgi:triacylglycerol lipase
VTRLDRVDPELRPMLALAPTYNLTAERLPALRARETALPLPEVVPNDVVRRDLAVPGPRGAPDIGLVIYTPPGPGPFACIYHVHGGGYVTGSAGILEFMHRPLAQELGCVIVSVDYRLAPETRFPGAIEDCYAGLAWVTANAAALGVDPARIGVMGESAGGGLAAALSLLVRDRIGAAPAFQCLTYPMLDDRTCVEDRGPHAGAFLWTPASNHFGWTALLGTATGGPDVSPYAAAARAETLAGLPPTFLMVGGLDLFVRENLDFAARLVAAGVPTELHVYPGAFHAFDVWPDAGIARRARQERVDALRRFTSPPPALAPPPA